MNKIKKEFERMSKKGEPILITTNNYTYVNGNTLEIMNLITMLVHSLKEQNYPKDTIKWAVKTGLLSTEEAKKTFEELISQFKDEEEN